MFYIYEKKNKNLILSLIVSVLVLIASIVALILFIENKRKKDEKELDEYLESSIQ